MSDPTAGPRDWDAGTYDRVADPMTRWGTAVLDRLPLRGDERVLDAGCGSGRVTEELVERLGPDGRVVALDGSPAMVEAARTRLARFGDRVEYVVADLGQPLPLGEPVDAILSTATFHWVPDHDAMFRHLAAVLRPGGWLVAQCGGVGNVKLRSFQGAYVGRVRLTEQHGEFTEHRAGLRHIGDLNAVLDDGDRALLEDEEPAGRRAGGEHCLAGLVGCKRKSAEPLLKGSDVRNQGHDVLGASLSRWNPRSRRLGWLGLAQR